MSDDKLLPDGHPLIGDGWRLLSDSEVIRNSDESNCLSTLRSIEHWDPWHMMTDEWGIVGRTVAEAKVVDMDGHERLYRRREQIQPVVYKVVQCSNCPMAHDDVQNSVFCNAPEDICSVPWSGRELDIVIGVVVIPDWCPLKKAPLLIKLEE